MTLLTLIPVVVPVLVGAVYLAVGWRRATGWLSVGSAAVVLAAGIALAVRAAEVGTHYALDGQLRVDALAAFMLILIGVVAVLATAATPAYFRAEIQGGRASSRTASRHTVLVQLFLASMALAVLAGNLGILWVTIEATTIVTAFLVGQRRTRAAVEAAWKYVVIGSTGIALALLGAVVLNFAGQGSAAAPGLDLAQLTAAASQLDPDVTRIGVLLLMLGFGAKAGLAPLHAWLPDAHSQAPAPVSALMSGVLLAVAVHAMLRVKVISDGALGPEFARTVLAGMALVSLLLSATLLLGQRDYKRMLAYSSIEHMGLVAFAVAVGSRFALYAALLHLLGHGLVKGVLFLGSGRMLQVTGTSRIGEVRGLAARQPVLAGCFGFGILALIGFPPFSVFASELGIARAGFDSSLAWATAIVLLVVLVIASAMIVHTGRMLLGSGSPAPVAGPGTAAAPRTMPLSLGIVLVGGLALCSLIGITAGPLGDLIALAAEIVEAP